MQAYTNNTVKLFKEHFLQVHELTAKINCKQTEGLELYKWKQNVVAFSIVSVNLFVILKNDINKNTIRPQFD